MKHRNTKKRDHRRHRKAKTNSLVLVLLISLLCYLATTTCGVVSALTEDEVAAKYPNCNVSNPSLIGDGKCNGGKYNTEKCGRDGGDCIVEGYPNCNVYYPSLIGNGVCYGGEYNTEACGWDGGDCDKFNEKYPNCNVGVPSLIGDGGCDGGEYNKEECGSDGGDCIEFNEKYPNCTVESPNVIGNGICDGKEYNTEECGWDGGDCEPPAGNSVEDIPDGADYQEEDGTSGVEADGSAVVRSIFVFLANLIIFGLVDISN